MSWETFFKHTRCGTIASVCCLHQIQRTLPHCHLVKSQGSSLILRYSLTNSCKMIHARITCSSTNKPSQTLHCPSQTRRLYSVLAVSNCVGHDGTSYTVLKRVEVEFWCGTCRCETETQCWLHRVNVTAAHFGARMHKRKLPGDEGMPNGTEIWFFQEANIDEIGWNLYGGIWTQRQTFSSGSHSPGTFIPTQFLTARTVQEAIRVVPYEDLDLGVF